MQRAHPPFGGFLGVPLSEISRIYVSPGPIYEPAARPGHGFDAAIRAAGVTRGDIVLNAWSYHLVPAGVAFDEAFRSVGATVVPSGVGNTALQAQVILDLGVTVVAASTAFFEALIEKIEGDGHRLPDDWRVRRVYLGAEFGDWAGKRRRLEERLGITTFSFYGTGDLGLVATECERRDGYHVVPEMIVQICDASGAVVGDGEPGEIVVTSLNDVWPLIRFGTGDASRMVPGPCSCGDPAPKLANLLGRVGQAVKVREIFVYPRHVQDLCVRVDGLRRAQCVVSRRKGHDEIDLVVELTPDADTDQVLRRVADEFSDLTRLRPGEIRVVPAGLLGDSDPLIVNHRDSTDAVLDRLVAILDTRVPQPTDSLDVQRKQFEELATRVPLPEGVDVTPAVVGGIPAEFLEVSGGQTSRALLWLHGGGYAIGSLNTVRPLAARIAMASRARVVAIDYRLAPESPYPAALEDALAAYRGLLREYSPDTIAVGGDSAGGGLTLALLMALRDAGEPLPAAGVCLSPWADLTMTATSYEAATAIDPQAARWQLAQMARAYLGGLPAETPLASPVFGAFQGLPPLLVHVGGAERLLDDAVVVATRAREAGVDVTLTVAERMLHVWHAFAPKLPQASAAIEEVGAWLDQRWQGAQLAPSTGGRGPS
jgi:phenylacetate-CoA ligase